MITWADVTALDPSLASIPAETQLALIRDAYVFVDRCTWDRFRDIAAKYLVAHMAVLSQRGGSAAGPVASEHLGDASTTYAVMQGDAMTDLDATSWGRAYRRLLRALGPFIVIG